MNWIEGGYSHYKLARPQLTSESRPSEIRTQYTGNRSLYRAVQKDLCTESQQDDSSQFRKLYISRFHNVR